MAEAWRLEDEEGELRELGRRRRRGNLTSAADRSERNKPDYRSSGQGPLSSIRAAIKRTSRASSHTEQQRERRRPEITIVAAEPLRPSSWFPGGNVTPQGLGFPSPSQANWRTNELVPAELPPSYEQVIKEINQVQVNTTNNNNAAAASRCTATSATQTDFPEEIISHLPRSNVKNNLPTLCESEIVPDPFQFPFKNEPAKEQTVQPAIARKPTVIRIPSKPGKSLNEVPHIPPPLPAEKPIGSTSGIVAGKPSNAKQTRKGESEHSDPTGTTWTEPVLPPRPVDGKLVPARLPPLKGIPGRPPPPKHSGTKTSSQKDPFCRSSSDLTLHKRHDIFGIGVKRAKSQVLKNQDPALPPRPKPGHSLYNKYMLPVPHGIAKDDFSPRNPGELSCKRGDVLVLLEQIDGNYFKCQKGGETGKVHLSHMKIITRRDEHLKSKQKDSNNIERVSDKSAPHAVVLHDFPAEHADDLDLHSGETVYLLEKIDNEWYRGKLENRTGIFPTNFVKVIPDQCKETWIRESERQDITDTVFLRTCLHLQRRSSWVAEAIDVPEEENKKKVLFSSTCIKGPRCIARFEYIGDQKDELSFSEGEIILLKEYINEEWASGELKGTSGIFPLNFVEIIEDLPGLGVGAPLTNKRESSACLSQTDRRSGEWCEALHDFTAETNEDLSFKKGDSIQILEHVDSEWCRGRLNDSEGIFPAVFVQTCSAGVKTAQSPGWRKGKAKALYDFQGENEDELSFKAGDMITELEPVDEDWMSGEVQGKSGIFPKNFVRVL
ncbi:SH3 domain-containing protein 19 isoform X7 [Lepidochelys kempii]|uniref:SH3 domain-containing protein 19 isoform X7 n=1 Tax=Lepidochelys kempii TaxID=8472 RepID=UPI003C6FCD71